MQKWAFVVALWVGGCSCGTTESCSSETPCPDGLSCVSGTCVGTDGGSDSALCADLRPTCGYGAAAMCCAATDVCMAGRCQEDCGTRARCGGVCCAEGLACENNSCVATCTDVSQRCGVRSDQCCTAGQACLGQMCVSLGSECDYTEECEVSEICEPSLQRCVPRASVEVCEYRPPVDVFTPRQACRWSPPAASNPESRDVVMSPAVVNLTDDNADGETNRFDTPDIVFVSYNKQADGAASKLGILRIVSGLCEEDGTMHTIASIAMPRLDNSGGVALGNLHGPADAAERHPEIVATTSTGGVAGVVAYRRTMADGSSWEVLWHNANVLEAARSASAPQPSIVDLNGDGFPEILVGNVVLNGLTGMEIWDGDVTVGTDSGVGNNAFLGPISTAADLDGDGTMEVIAGNTIYRGTDGAEVATYVFPDSLGGTCARGAGCDGYSAVGNFDTDPQGEIVLVRQGEVFVLQHDATLLARVTLPRLDCTANESGPPTVADFDGDGRPEIGTAGADYYMVVDLDCLAMPLPAGCDSPGILWKVANQDCSSRATGSSVFDFEGDGAAEVIYADETSFRIFDGATGRVKFEDATHRSHTRLEMPIVVDVDNDGKSEVVVPEPTSANGSLGGIDVWEDSANNWVRTRRVWNQHSYHVTNIDEDGQIPALEPQNFANQRLNNFRQNVQPAGVFDAPDLTISSLTSLGCSGSAATFSALVRNIGALGVAAGVPVLARIEYQGMSYPVVVRTSRFLLPGQMEALTFSFTPASWNSSNISIRVQVDQDTDGSSRYNECNEENNSSVDVLEVAGCGLG